MAKHEKQAGDRSLEEMMNDLRAAEPQPRKRLKVSFRGALARGLYS